MEPLEIQLQEGQAALGRLMRQFFAINDFKHVQFMAMGNALTSVRWLHSSQISVLKRGGTKHLTGFPLYSIALVNRRIWEINTGIAGVPKGGRASDWEDKTPIMVGDKPADVGDLWRIYFGEMKPPLFYESDMIEISDQDAARISHLLHQTYVAICDRNEQDEMVFIKKALNWYPSKDDQDVRVIKGVLLGLTEMSKDQAELMASDIAELFSELTSKQVTAEQVLKGELSHLVS